MTTAVGGGAGHDVTRPGTSNGRFLGTELINTTVI